MLEFLFPYETLTSVHTILDEIGIYNSSSREALASLGLDEAQGELSPTTDPSILDQLDQSGLQRPGLRKVENVKMD